MNNFHFYNPASIYFGKGEEKKVGELVTKYSHNKHVLVLSSGDYIDSLGILAVIKQEFSSKKITFSLNTSVVPNPELSLIHSLIDQVKTEGIDFILAVGGGSVIDTAKAVALGAKYDGDVWDFFSGKATVSEALPIGAIATMASSGSEMSNATIISNGEYKLGVEDNCIIPKFSILNPEFTVNLPAYPTAVGLADITTHLLERYFTNDLHNHLTDHLIEGAMKTHIALSGKLLNDPTNYDLRAEIMWTAVTAHNNSLECGRTPDWASHRIEHEISGQYGVVHGEGMAIIMPAWMTYVSEHHPDIFKKYAVRVFDVDPFIYSEKEIIQIGIDKTKEFFDSLGLKSRLSELSIDETNFLAMANRATKEDESPIGHLEELYSKNIVQILKLAL